MSIADETQRVFADILPIHLSGYEPREPQVRMARVIAEALEAREHAIAEAGTGTGKCVHGETLIPLIDGTLAPIRELYTRCVGGEALQAVWSMSPEFRIVPVKPKAIHRREPSRLVTLRTRFGRSIVVTEDHKFFTYPKWVEARSLKPGDMIATPRIIPVRSDLVPLADSEIDMLALLLADGTLHPKASIAYCKKDPDLRAHMIRVADQLGCVTHEASGHNISIAPKVRGSNRVRGLLRQLGLMGHTAHDKFIPGVIFAMSQSKVARFIGMLWSGDGSVEKRGVASYSTMSETLARGLQHLLLRLGIVARLRTKPVRYNGQLLTVYEMTFYGEQVLRFARICGDWLIGEKRERLRAIAAKIAEAERNTNIDVIPAALWNELDHALARSIGFRKGRRASGDSRRITRSMLLAYAEAAKESKLYNLATSDLFWDEVTSVEPAGSDETFCLEMPAPYHNFVANDLIVHNSLAASVPGILYALDQGGPLVISTGTIALQEQYVRKDLPFLQAALDEPFSFALAKGRGNYVCKIRLDEELRDIGIFSPSPLLEWAARTTDTGDLADYPGAPGEEWGRINVDEACTGSVCRFYGSCWYYAARRAAERATVVVVNHALLMADLVIRAATRGNASLLPDPAAVIIDEAHHLETAAREAFGDRLPTGRVRHITRAVRRMGLAVDDDTLTAVERTYEAIFDHVSALVTSSRAVRLTGLPDDLIGAWDDTAADLLAALKRATAELPEEAAERVERLRDLLRRTVGTVQAIGANEEPGETVYWAEWENGARVVLHSTPVDVAPLLRQHLFSAGYPVILMSATLAVGGADTMHPFAHVRRRIGLDAARELRVESPFDYRSNCLLYVPRPERLPDPKAPDYHERLVPFIEEILLATQGRAFVLFTSYRGMQTVYEHLRGRLRYLVLRQGEAPKHELVRRFREDGNAVLFATSSFWEGVDVPGEALSCVIIDRIPFAVPDDPVEAAVAEAVERAGGDAFWDVQLPNAIVRLKQGFGRLIRSKTDRGIVALLDKRVRERRYGRLILASLPPARRIEALDGVELWFAAGKGAVA